MRTLRTGLLGALYILVSSCGAPAASSTETAAVAVAGLIECDEIGLQATCHSCGHAVAGPFMSVTANAIDASFVFVDIDTVHTYHEIGLLSTATAGEHAGAVTYFPNSEELRLYAFYMSTPAELRIFDEASNEVPIGHEHSISADTDCLSIGYPSLTGCDQHLPVVKIFELTGAAPYTVTLGPTTATSVALVVENLDSIGGWFAPDVDGDGKGDQAEGESSWCAELPGYVGNSDDCDDADPTVYYDAPELCDGVDNNCDEVSDANDPTLCAESSDGHLCLVAGGNAQCSCGDDDDCEAGSKCTSQRCEVLDGASDASVVADAAIDADATVEEGPSMPGVADTEVPDTGLEPSDASAGDDEPVDAGQDGTGDAEAGPIARDGGSMHLDDADGENAASSQQRNTSSGCSAPGNATKVSWTHAFAAAAILSVFGARRPRRRRALQMQLD